MLPMTPAEGIDILTKIRAVPSIFEEPPKKPVIPEDNEETIDQLIPTQSKDDENLITSTPVVTRKETATSSSQASTTSDSKDDFLLDNGFNLQENYYTKGSTMDPKLELPARRITDEDSLIGDSTSVGDLSQVEVILVFV